MENPNFHYTPKYLNPRHALIHKRCRFCHHEMEIKQINSSEALRMCFKCSTPLQQLELDDIEFFQRSYYDMLKSPLEWNSNMSNQEDDLSKLTLWIENMEIKVKEYEDSSDEETAEISANFTPNQKSLGETSKNKRTPLEDSSHDWQSEAFNELEAALEKASCEESQGSLPFSFDDLFLSNDQTEETVCPSSKASLGSTQETQAVGCIQSKREISTEQINEKHVIDSCQSELKEFQGNNGHSEDWLNSDTSNSCKIQQTVPEVNKAKEDIEITNSDESNIVNEKLHTSETLKNDIHTECQMSIAPSETLAQEKVSSSLTPTFEDTSTELQETDTASKFKILSETSGLFTAVDESHAADDKSKTAEDVMKTKNGTKSNEPEMCQNETISETSENMALVVHKKYRGDDGTPRDILKNSLIDESSDSSESKLFPDHDISGTEDHKNSKSKSSMQYGNNANNQKLANPIPKSLSQPIVSQVENDVVQSTVVLTNKCGSPVPLSVWASISEYVAGNTLLYEHVCDCDEKPIQLSPANCDRNDSQCVNLVLPDLSPLSLLEEDIIKSKHEDHSLDKILFSPLEKSVRKKCSSRKLNFLETAIEETSENSQTVPVLLATIPADSDITPDMLQVLSQENETIIFEDSFDSTQPSCYQNVGSSEKILKQGCNSSVDYVNLETNVLPSSDANEHSPQNLEVISANLGQTPMGMTLNIEDFKIKIDFNVNVNDQALSSTNINYNNVISKGMDCPSLQEFKEINISTRNNIDVENEFGEVDSCISLSERSSYSQFSEDIDKTCSSSITMRKEKTPSVGEKPFSMMIDRPLQLHDITIEEDDEELKCFSGSKFKPIGNRKQSLKEGKIESEPRVMNLLKSVRKEVNMSKKQK